MPSRPLDFNALPADLSTEIFRYVTQGGGTLRTPPDATLVVYAWHTDDPQGWSLDAEIGEGPLAVPDDPDVGPFYGAALAAATLDGTTTWYGYLGSYVNALGAALFLYATKPGIGFDSPPGDVTTRSAPTGPFSYGDERGWHSADAVSWIDADDVTRLQPSVADSPDLFPLLETAATVASGVMFNLSGRQFRGSSKRTVRPARQPCSCFAGGVNWYWNWDSVYPGAWTWRNERGDHAGCGALSQVRLAGYPVTRVEEVKIDGAVVAADGYRLDQRRYLTRLADPGPPAVDRSWPACQNLALADTEPGTFAVTYTSGVDPPELGKLAAAQLAAEVFAALKGDESKLPSGVVEVVRQGVTIKRVISTAEALRAGSTGLELVDLFIADVNPAKLRRRSAVFTPDVQRFARRLGP